MRCCHCGECDDFIVFDKYEDEPAPGALGSRQEMGEVADRLEEAAV
jgi:hypothetical protein